MLLNFEHTVSALTYSLIQQRCPSPDDGDDGFANNRVARFVLAQHGRMPDYLRWPLRLLTLAFDAAAVPMTGRPFHALPHERRRRQILAWKRSAFGFRRDLMKFYENLVILGWYPEGPFENAGDDLAIVQS